MYLIKSSNAIMFCKRDPRTADPYRNLLFQDTVSKPRMTKKKGAKKDTAKKVSTPTRRWYTGITKGMKTNSMRKIKFKEISQEDSGVNVNISTDGEDVKLGKVFVDFIISRTTRGY